MPVFAIGAVASSGLAAVVVYRTLDQIAAALAKAPSRWMVPAVTDAAGSAQRPVRLVGGAHPRIPALPHIRKGWRLFGRGRGSDAASPQVRDAVHATIESLLAAAQREAALQSIEHAASLPASAADVLQEAVCGLFGAAALLRASGASGRSAGGVLLSTRQQPATAASAAASAQALSPGVAARRSAHLAFVSPSSPARGGDAAAPPTAEGEAPTMWLSEAD